MIYQKKKKNVAQPFIKNLWYPSFARKNSFNNAFILALDF